MIKEKKYSLVNDLIERYEESSYVFLFDFTGVKVEKLIKLRTALDKKATANVVKNTLNKIASKKKFNNIHPSLVGQVLTISTNDPVLVAKACVNFIKNEQVGKLIACSDGKNLYDSDGVKYFATLPSENEMKAKIISAISAVPQKLLFSLNAVQTNTLRLIKQKYSS